MRHLLAAATLGLTLAAPASATTYAIDPTHTFVTYEIGHYGTSTNRGRFDKKEGTVQFDRAAKSGISQVAKAKKLGGELEVHRDCTEFRCRSPRVSKGDTGAC